MKVRFLLLLTALALTGCTTTNAQSSPPRTIGFSGYEWQVKNYAGAVGPGPNYFSDSTRNVWVDQSGRLHLKIEKRKGTWFCAEIICTASLGHGTYRFFLDSEVGSLDPNVVLGLFTWSDTPAFNNREIDIEFSRWGNRNGPNAQFVVQPYFFADNLWSYFLPLGLTQTTHSFSWTPDAVYFQSLLGHQAVPSDPGDILAQFLNAGPDVPPAGDETPRINLWLRQGRTPTNRQSVEVIISRFEFESL